MGAIIGGRLADRHGRRHNILLLALVFIVGTVGSALSGSVLILSVFRFILGFAVGRASSSVPMYLSSPPRSASAARWSPSTSS